MINQVQRRNAFDTQSCEKHIRKQPLLDVFNKFFIIQCCSKSTGDHHVEELFQ